MYYLQHTLYKAREDNYKQVYNLKLLLEKKHAVTTVGHKYFSVAR